jgi:hypothetical protein
MARRFGPSRPGSSANIGEPWEMNIEGAVVMVFSMGNGRQAPIA